MKNDSKIVFGVRKLIYQREFYDVTIFVGKKIMHLDVEVEGEKIIRHSPSSAKDITLWNNLTTEQRIDGIDSILRDEFEF